MDSLPPDLIEMILSYLQTKDIKNISSVSIKYNSLVNSCIRIGSFFSAKILNCVGCSKHNIYPTIMKLRIANRPNGNKKYIFCSKNCKSNITYGFPRCYFCLSTVTYVDRIDRTLFCSQTCVQSAEQNAPRGRYLL